MLQATQRAVQLSPAMPCCPVALPVCLSAPVCAALLFHTRCSWELAPHALATPQEERPCSVPPHDEPPRPALGRGLQPGRQLLGHRVCWLRGRALQLSTRRTHLHSLGMPSVPDISECTVACLVAPPLNEYRIPVQHMYALPPEHCRTDSLPPHYGRPITTPHTHCNRSDDPTPRCNYATSAVKRYSAAASCHCHRGLTRKSKGYKRAGREGCAQAPKRPRLKRRRGKFVCVWSCPRGLLVQGSGRPP